MHRNSILPILMLGVSCISRILAGEQTLEEIEYKSSTDNSTPIKAKAIITPIENKKTKIRIMLSNPSDEHIFVANSLAGSASYMGNGGFAIAGIDFSDTKEAGLAYKFLRRNDESGFVEICGIIDLEMHVFNRLKISGSVLIPEGEDKFKRMDFTLLLEQSTKQK